MTEDSSKTECVSIHNSSKICTEGNHTVYSEDCNDNTLSKQALHFTGSGGKEAYRSGNVCGNRSKNG